MRLRNMIITILVLLLACVALPNQAFAQTSNAASAQTTINNAGTSILLLEEGMNEESSPLSKEELKWNARALLLGFGIGLLLLVFIFFVLPRWEEHRHEKKRRIQGLKALEQITCKRSS